MKVYRITNLDLFVKGILPCLVVEVIVLILWTVIDPFIPVIVTESIFLLPTQQYLTCRSTSPWPVIVFLGLKGVYLIFGIIISYKIRGIKAVDYNESTAVGMSIYTATLVAVIAVVLNLVIAYNTFIEVGIQALAIFVTATFVLIWLFVPKFHRIFAYHDESIKETKSTEGTQTQTTRVAKTGSISTTVSDKDSSV